MIGCVPKRRFGIRRFAALQLDPNSEAYETSVESQIYPLFAGLLFGNRRHLGIKNRCLLPPRRRILHRKVMKASPNPYLFVGTYRSLKPSSHLVRWLASDFWDRCRALALPIVIRLTVSDVRSEAPWYG